MSCICKAFTMTQETLFSLVSLQFLGLFLWMKEWIEEGEKSHMLQ